MFKGSQSKLHFTLLPIKLFSKICPKICLALKWHGHNLFWMLMGKLLLKSDRMTFSFKGKKREKCVYTRWCCKETTINMYGWLKYLEHHLSKAVPYPGCNISGHTMATCFSIVCLLCRGLKLLTWALLGTDHQDRGLFQKKLLFNICHVACVYQWRCDNQPLACLQVSTKHVTMRHIIDISEYSPP